MRREIEQSGGVKLTIEEQDYALPNDARQFVGIDLGAQGQKDLTNWMVLYGCAVVKDYDQKRLLIDPSSMTV